MSEAGKTSESPHEKITPTSHELPTTGDIAKQGAADFRKVAHMLPQHIQQRVLEYHPLRPCFIGSMPEIQVYFHDPEGRELSYDLGHDLSVSDFALFQKTVHAVSPDYIFVNKVYHQNRHVQFTSMVNLRAAIRVVENHCSYFPEEAHLNLREWLQNQPEEWSGNITPLQTMRHGLLSGYPEWSVTAYAEKINRSSYDCLSEEEQRFLLQCERGEVGLSEEDMRRYDVLLDRVANKKSFIDPTQVIQAKSITGYVGSDLPRDLEYVRQLDEIYDKSDIEQVV